MPTQEETETKHASGIKEQFAQGALEQTSKSFLAIVASEILIPALNTYFGNDT